MKKTFCDACGRELKESDSQKLESKGTKPKVRVDVLTAETEDKTEKVGDYCLRCVVEAVVETYNARKTNGDRVKLVKPRRRTVEKMEKPK